ncbi:hypothetical protein [Cellulomonas sp. ICMP 17802]|uniref:hypothetical protein n=1 Tax=Cellulomonas sp. ICMP 17802 TaxID=3239199 RepID=UPI00351BACE9
MAATLATTRLYDVADDHQPEVGATVWAVAHPIGEAPDGPDQRWVLVMGEVMGVRLDTPGWPNGQVWSTERLCREHAWSRHVVGRRRHTGFEVLRLDVVTPSLFRLATD